MSHTYVVGRIMATSMRMGCQHQPVGRSAFLLTLVTGGRLPISQIHILEESLCVIKIPQQKDLTPTNIQRKWGSTGCAWISSFGKTGGVIITLVIVISIIIKIVINSIITIVVNAISL